MVMRAGLLLLLLPAAAAAEDERNLLTTRGRTCDSAGIAELYPSSTTAPRTWMNSWSDSTREMTKVMSDQGDAAATMRGSGRISIDGDTGVASMSGSPRYYVGDPNEEQTWNNVELTVYAKRVSDGNLKSYSGFTLVARTSHDLYKTQPCEALSYYARIYFKGSSNGRAAFQKEFFHQRRGSPKTIYSRSKRVHSGLRLEDGSRGVPANTWVGTLRLHDHVENTAVVCR